MLAFTSLTRMAAGLIYWLLAILLLSHFYILVSSVMCYLQFYSIDLSCRHWLVQYMNSSKGVRIDCRTVLRVHKWNQNTEGKFCIAKIVGLLALETEDFMQM